MDNLIQISKINDFIFCPYSIYLHEIYSSFHQSLYHETSQSVGKMAHENIDKNSYSSRKDILQGLTVVSLKYGLIGKIDIYDQKNQLLLERKQTVKKIFNGYCYQLYAQYFGLKEAGYKIKKLRIHSLSDNKNYDLPLPDPKEISQFKEVIEKMKNFSINSWRPKINTHKCPKCIYRCLCSFANVNFA